MSRLLVVTGATGFVGSSIALARGERVRTSVRSAQSAEAVAQIGAEVVEGDVADEASWCFA